MATPYTTKAQVTSYLQQDIDSSFDTRVNAYIAAMSEYCDTLAGFPIYTNTATTRLYDGNNQRTLLIDPVHSITEVLADGDNVTSTVLKAPYNSDVKTELIYKDDLFAQDVANISVTGKFSLKSALPDQVAFACTVFVAVILNQVKDQKEGVKSEKIGEYSVSFASDDMRADYKQAKEIIEALRPISF
jgi:hypothetical protein